MDSLKAVYLTKSCEGLFRKQTDGDNMIILYGIDNNILGGWKSEDFESFGEISMNLPSNLKINGFAFIYNDNVYEDFDSLIQINLEKIKNLKKNFCEKFQFVFVLKDMKYVDDFEDLNYEKNTVYELSKDLQEHDVDIITQKNLENLNKNFCFLNSDITLQFFTKEEYKKFEGNASYNNDDCITVNFEDYENSVKKIFEENFFIFLEKENFFLDKIKQLDDIDITKVTTMLKKIDINKADLSDKVR